MRRMTEHRSDYMSATYSGIDGYVGNTPLIRLRRAVRIDGLRDSGKSGIHESGRFGERSSGLRNHH